jgi:hypothetical protein
MGSMKGKLLGLMAMASAMHTSAGMGGGMYGSPGNRWDNLPDVPRGSGEPNYEGFALALDKHMQKFKDKPTYEINGLYIQGLTAKHAHKVLRKLMAEYNLPQFQSAEELAKQIKYITGIDIEEDEQTQVK